MSRILKATGWWRMLFIIAFGFLAGAILYRQMQVFPACIYATVLLIVAIVIIHVYRSDKSFISTTGVLPHRLFAAEYMLFSLPVICIILFSRHWYYGFIFLAGCILVPMIRINPLKRKRRGHAIPFVSYDNFEWLSGIRKNRWYLVSLYLVALGLLYYPYVSLFILWLLLATVSSFYVECESWQTLQLKELSPQVFIRTKLKTHLKTYALYSCPIILGYMIFHMDTAWIAILAYIFSFINLAFFILSKYALYQPNEKLTANTLLVSIIHLTMLIPFLFPLPLVMGVRAYNKAKNNLKNYLDAYD